MEKKEWVFTQVQKPKEYFVIAAVFAAMGVFCGIITPYVSTEPIGVPGRIFWLIVYMVLMSPVCLIFLAPALTKITVSRDGAVMSLGKREMKRLEAGRVCTIAKGYADLQKGGGTLLYISATAAEEIEQKGEAALGKIRIIRNDMKFRKGKSDWKDLCLGAGLVGIKDAIRIEFTEERKQLLLELFPQAEYRVGKHFNDPPSLV